MTKKKLTYLLAVTADYVFAAGNVVLSLIKQRPEKDFEVTIYYDEILPSDKKIFEDTGICTLVQYTPPEGFEEEIRQRCPKFNDEQFSKHFSFLKFAKFECFSLLEKYEHVVWLDVDISVQRDPIDIIRYGVFAITIDRNWTVQNNFTQPIEGYDMEQQGVCSAVFMISDQLKNYEVMTDWCYKKAIEVSPYFKNIDQGIYNLLLQEFKVDYELLPLDDYQCFTDRDDAVAAKIVHFGGPSKVWNHTEIIASFPEWYRMHLSWKDLGGSDFTRQDNFSVVNVYNKLRTRNVRIAHLQKKITQLESRVTHIPLQNKVFCENMKITLFGIPIYRVKKKENATVYYFFSIPVVRILESSK